MKMFGLAFLLTVVAKERKKMPFALTHLMLRPRVVTTCKDPDNAMNITSSHFIQTGSNYLINNKFTMSRGAKLLTQAIVEVTKCAEAESFNTCEFFQTWRFSENLCNLIFNPKSLFTGYIGHIHPKFGCPLQKGYYETVNASIDVSVLELVPVKLEGNVWKAKVRLFDENKDMLSCMIVIAEFLRTRIKS